MEKSHNEKKIIRNHFQWKTAAADEVEKNHLKRQSREKSFEKTQWRKVICEHSGEK